jgi:hypothetical protein
MNAIWASVKLDFFMLILRPRPNPKLEFSSSGRFKKREAGHYTTHTRARGPLRFTRSLCRSAGRPERLGGGSLLRLIPTNARKLSPGLTCAVNPAAANKRQTAVGWVAAKDGL